MKQLKGNSIRYVRNTTFEFHISNFEFVKRIFIIKKKLKKEQVFSDCARAGTKRPEIVIHFIGK